MKKYLLVLSALLGTAALASVTVPYTFSPGTTISSSQVNADFSAVANEINGHENATNPHQTTLSQILNVGNSCGTQSIDFNENQALHMRAENVTVDPTAGNLGRVIYNTTSGIFKVDNGSTWVSIVGASFPNLASVLAGGNTAGTFNIDMQENQLLDARVENVTSLPSAGNPGRVVYDTATSALYADSGTAFVQVGVPALTNTHLFVGNASNVPTDVALSGDASITNAGALTVNAVGGSTAANIHNAEIAANGATSSNTASKIVARDGSGNFSAGTITATLSGNSTNVSGIVGILNGGTGQTTANAALNALLPSQATFGGDCFKTDGTNGSWGACGAGTVTSVNVTAPPYLTVTGGPITSAGTIALTGTSESANLFLASPNGSSGAMTPRAIVAADIPTLNQNTTGTATNVTGTVAIANGGTGQTTQTAAFDALSPNTTKGDIAVNNGTHNVRHATPADYGFMVPDSSQTDGWRNATYTQTSGRPTKNYVQYADFENNATTGWSLGTVGTLTNGLPTGTPTFGSGASGNLSIATSSTGPLAGTYSLTYVSSAATTQGNMLASQSYAVDSEDEAKVLSVKFFYTPSSNPSNGNWSGTSSNSFAWAAWDVTNSAWLTSAGNFCMVQSSGSGICTGTFQTGSTTANIRFVLYNANATSGAITLKLDDFYVGPQTQSMGPAMSDWQSYTATITGTTTNPTKGTIVRDKAYYRRVGDQVEIRYEYQQSAAGSAGSGTYLFSLPSGISIDTAKITVNAGNVGATSGATQFFDGTTVTYGTVQAYDSTHFFFTNGSGGAVVGSSNVALSNTTVYYATEARFPVVGWSSNTVQSSDTDTRVIATQARLANNVTTSGIIIFDTLISDKSGSYSTSTGLFTCPVSGVYTVTATLLGNNTWTPYVGKNGVAVASLTAGTSTTTVNGSVDVVCNAGDTLGVYSNAASLTLTGDTGAPSHNYVSFSRKSGPAVVQATESVSARYTSTSTSSVGTGTPVTYATKVFDSHNAFSGTVYTAPVSGTYDVSASFIIASGTPTIRIYKNGTYYSQGSAGAGFQITSIKDQVQLNAGDTVEIRADATYTLANNAQAAYFNIRRVGN